MSPNFRKVLVTLGGALASSLLLTGCSGNIACVFAPGGCGSIPPGALAENAAGSPFTGMEISDLPPEIVGLHPDTTTVAPTTPIVLIFSESMQGSSLQGAFEVASIISPSLSLPLSGQLVAEGRMFIAFPPMELDAGDYQVRTTPMSQPTDITGQARPAGDDVEVLLNFTVSADLVEPQLVATFPEADATDVSEMGDIVVVFDRPMEAMSVDGDSFVVDDNGTILTTPTITPVLIGVPPAALSDTRAFILQAPGLDVGGDVSVTLSSDSAAGPQIVDDTVDANPLPETSFTFAVTQLTTPVSGLILSDPVDAIGSANLIEGGANELSLQVGLIGAQQDDFVDVFVFGDSADPVRRIAVRGSFEIDELVPDPNNPMLGLAAIPILIGPGNPRFVDGELDIAMRLRRGGNTSFLRLFDADLTSPLIQNSVRLDTIGPEVLELLLPGGFLTFARSDTRDLVILGSANERVRAVDIVAGGMTNQLTAGEVAPVAGTAGTLFMSAPVPLGVIAGASTAFTLTAYDAALNPSAPITGSFEQLGALQTGSSMLALLEIDVFDIESLAPLSGATVFVNSDAGDGVNYPSFSSGMTGADGTLLLAFDPGASAVIVTVDLAGYDLFTVHGAPNTALSIPLHPIGDDSALASGVITSVDPNASFFLPIFDSFVSETRFPVDSERTTPVLFCGTMLPIMCPYGPTTMRANMYGAQAFVAGTPALNGLEADFAERLIESFAVNLPTDLAGRGVTFTNQIQIERLLSDAATPADEIPLVLPDLEFDASGATGVDLANLDDDLLTTGEPRVSVDLVVSGLTGSLTVGGGVSIDLGGGSWMVRSAYPGILNRPGFLGSSATGEQRLRVRFEVRDLNGNASVRRPKIADLPMVPVPFVLPAVAQLVAPTMATGGFPLTLQLSNSIPNEGEGFYRVELMDSDATPRKWVLWRFDPLGAADVLARFPVSGALASGTLTVKISTFQRDAGFSSFLWTDLENDYDGYTRTADSTLNHP